MSVATRRTRKNTKRKHEIVYGAQSEHGDILSRYTARSVITSAAPVHAVVDRGLGRNYCPLPNFTGHHTCATMRFSMPLDDVSLLGVIASTSSMNTMQGAFSIAARNNSRT